MMRVLMVMVGIVVLCAQTRGQETEMIASLHPNDVGIERAPAVVFADNFEAWGTDGKGPGRWTGLHLNNGSLTSAVPGKVSIDGREGPGQRVLAIQCWNTGGSATGGVFLHLGNYTEKDQDLGDGYEDLYVRYYFMFDPTYKPMMNHGANLGGRDLARPGARWVGQAGTTDVSRQRYFFSGLQPSSSPRDFHMQFYSYHMDKPGWWGDGYPIRKKVPIELGRWYCLERHMRLNTVEPLKADGLEELWVDGELSVRREGLRFRNIPTLRINFFSLETYYHRPDAAYTREHPIKVYVDHLVIAKSYIGPMATKAVTTRPGNRLAPPPGWDPNDR